MHCIFCKRDSTASHSVEHIIPESLGNEEHILPPGVVCDACNNYFAGSIEQVVLESGAFKTARFHMLIPSKRRRIPTVEGMLLPLQPGMTLQQAIRFHSADVSRDTDGNYILFPSDAAVDAVANGYITRMIISTAKPDSALFARFLGKIAVESMAARILENAPHMLDDFAHDDQLDYLRNYARYGKHGLDWLFSERRIYSADFSFPTSDGGYYEVLHEFDFLYTDQGEMYFVLAIMGVEYAMNMAGPDYEGYTQWLAEHNGASPLYVKKGFPG